MEFPEQQQIPPGNQSEMNPVPDCGEDSYRGSGKLTGKRTLITGGDSGIGRAAAIAFAREGADVANAYLNEHDDAKQVHQLIEAEGRRAISIPGDLSEASHCRSVIDTVVGEWGGLDVLVINAAYQMTHHNLQEISDEEWDYTFKLNVGAFFYLAKAATPHMPAGSSIIATPRSTPIRPTRRWRRTRRRNQRSRTSAPASRSSSGRTASGSTVWRRDRSGLR